jgi:hypothetical protein
MGTAREVATAIARPLGGEVRALPTDGVELVVVVPGGRVPVLVREFPSSLGACVPRGVAVVGPVSTFDAARIAELVASARAWLAKRDPEIVSMYGLAIALLDTLATGRGERWIASTPGTPDPTELWLHAPNRDAGSVGVFPTKAVIWLGMTALTFSMTTLAELGAARPRIMAAVAEQRARFERHVAASARISATADALAARLAAHTKLPSTVSRSGTASYAFAESATIASGTRQVTLTVVDDAIRIHAGLTGKDGFECGIDDLDRDFDLIVAALAEARVKLTVGDLRVRMRYRVREAWQGLAAGDEVTYAGLDDIDNHYGEYLFDTVDGRRITVGGDCSHPESGPLRDVHRYLEPV